jgi:hypothetical protein
MPSGGGNLAATVHNGLIYTFGGSAYTPWAAFNHVYAYDPQTHEWTPKKNMPTARFGLQSFLVNDKIFAMGGSQYSNTTLSTIEVYDPLNDTWETRENMPFSNVFLTGAVANDKIYVIGGTPDWFTAVLNVWEYDPLLVEVEQESTSPTEFNLYQNYPNPFNPSTTISYSIPKTNIVVLKVYDMLGSEVAVLVNKEQSQGSYKIEFDGTDLASGIYFYQIQTKDFVETKKMSLLK